MTGRRKDPLATVFDEIAAGYDDEPFHQVVAGKLVIGAADAPSPGLVLDVATGTGAVAFARCGTWVRTGWWRSTSPAG